MAVNSLTYLVNIKKLIKNWIIIIFFKIKIGKILKWSFDEK